MSYTKPHISDITSKYINDIDNVEEADNYIDWITYEVKNNEKYPDYKQYTFSLENNNNNVATTSQENIFTNENQNGNDILAASAGYVMNNQNNTNNILAANAGYETYETNNIVDECYFPNKNSDIDKKLGELEAANDALIEKQNQNKKKINSIIDTLNELNPLCDIVVDDYDIDINPQYPRPYDSTYKEKEEEKEEVNKNTIYDEEQEQKKVGELIRQYQELTGQCITIQDNNKEPDDTVQVPEKTANTGKRIIKEMYTYDPHLQENKQNSEYQNGGQDLLKLVEPQDNTMNEDESNIDNNNQFLSIKNVCEIKEKLKEKIKRYHTKTIEIRPHFININNKNEKTINIRDNHCIDITNNQYS